MIRDPLDWVKTDEVKPDVERVPDFPVNLRDVAEVTNRGCDIKELDTIPAEFSALLDGPAMKRSKPLKHRAKVSTAFVARANPKAKARQLQSEWEAMLKTHSKPLFGTRIAPPTGKTKPVELKPMQAPVRDTGPKIASLNSFQGSTAKAPPKVYTGTEMLGIAQMHKSNAVPVFRKEDAIDVAKMRRN